MLLLLLFAVARRRPDLTSKKILLIESKDKAPRGKEVGLCPLNTLQADTKAENLHVEVIHKNAVGAGGRRSQTRWTQK